MLRVWEKPKDDGAMGRCIDEAKGLDNNCLVVNLSYYLIIDYKSLQQDVILETMILLFIQKDINFLYALDYYFWILNKT